MDKNVLKSIIIESREFIESIQLNKRNVTFEDNLNYVLVGIRRSGKSTILFQKIKELVQSGIDMKKILYINFEDERLLEMKKDDLNQILEAYYEMNEEKPILFFDEIQLIDGWEKFVRRLADTKYTTYITGSNAKMLSAEIATTLGGRFLIVYVYPYSFYEFLNAKNIAITDETIYSIKQYSNIVKCFDEYLQFGGFPEIVNIIAKRDYLSSVYQKIYLGDIITRYNLYNEYALKIILKKIAESVGDSISYSRIFNIVKSVGIEIGKTTVINYIQYIQEAWLLFNIKNYILTLGEKESNPKYYFVDNGILNLFLVNSKSQLLENLIAINLIEKYGKDNQVYFYKKDIEVDFYIPSDNVAIQVCYSLEKKETIDREIKALIKFSKIKKCSKYLIITENEEKEIEIDDIKISILPATKWLIKNKVNQNE